MNTTNPGTRPHNVVALKNNSQQRQLMIWVTALFVTMAFAMLYSASARASHEGGDWSDANWNNNHVTVFSDCGYSGLSKQLPLGEFQNMKRVGVDQNAISSIIIPEGVAVEIFQKNKFRGHWYRLNRSQECLKGNWNDRIGSMRVVTDDVKNSYGFSDAYGGSGDACLPFTVKARRGEGGFRLVDSERRLNEIRRGRTLEGEICGERSVRVELAKRDQSTNVVLDIGGKRYRFGPDDAYDDFRRDWYRQYLTIDLPRSGGGDDDMVYGRNNWGDTDGFDNRYSSGISSGDNWGNNYRRNWDRGGRQGNNSGGESVTYNNTSSGSNSNSNSNSNSSSGCTSYRILGNHPDTGMRFLTGDQQFYQVGNGSIDGDLCQVGAVRVELAKKNPGSTVVLQIGGRSYVFRGGDKGDQYSNYWYRKYVTINVR